MNIVSSYLNQQFVLRPYSGRSTSGSAGGSLGMGTAAFLNKNNSGAGMMEWHRSLSGRSVPSAVYVKSTKMPAVSDVRRTRTPGGSSQTPGGRTKAPGGRTKAPGGRTQTPGRRIQALYGSGQMLDWRRQLRALDRSRDSPEAVITVIEKTGKESASDASGENQKEKRIVNTQALAAMSDDRKNGYIDLTDAQTSEEEMLKERFHYNSHEVSSEVQRAKTSTGAGQALVKATRKVMELKRKLAVGKDDSQDIQLALAHAKQIERAARKKKRHLELEELIVSTQERDERQKEVQESQTSVSLWDERDVSEEEVSDELAELDRQQTEAFAAIAETRRTELPENVELNEKTDDELVASIDALLEKLTGKEQQMLEDTLEQLELTEVVNPHMSKEDLKLLRIKHRNAERRDIVKADTDYLKATFELLPQKGITLPAYASYGIVATANLPGTSGFPAGTAGFVPAVSSFSMVDVQV